ncbi:MAG TPA: hypothetical protein VFZ47_09835 [Chitinophagaceae bacterium]
MKLILLSALTCFFLFAANISHSQSSDGNSVDVIAKWKKGETHTIQVHCTTTDIEQETKNFLTVFDATFKVAEETETNYMVEWTYTKVKLAENDPNMENLILAGLINTKFLLKLSEYGAFVELANLNEVKVAAAKVVDKLINETSNKVLNQQLNGVRPMLESRQGLETLLLKHVKLNILLYGYNYVLPEVKTHNIKYPNAFGGQPFDAVEKVIVSELNAKDSTFVIESKKTVEGNDLKNAIINFLKKNPNVDQKAIDGMVSGSLEMSDMSRHQISFSKGTIQNAYYKRVINAGIQNRTLVVEVRQIN